MNEEKDIFNKNISESRTTNKMQQSQQLSKSNQKVMKKNITKSQYEKEQAKMEKNRKRARETRKRKKYYIQLLEQKIQLIQNLDSAKLCSNNYQEEQDGLKLNQFQLELLNEQ